MIEASISFDCLPVAVANLQKSVNVLSKQVAKLQEKNSDNYAQWMNIKQLCEYLPDKPALQTVYEWVSKKLIPYHKKGKKLFFLKTEIDEWLFSGSTRINDKEQTN